MVKKNSENNSENSENSGLQFERIHTFAAAIPGTLGTRLQLIFEMMKQILKHIIY